MDSTVMVKVLELVKGDVVYTPRGERVVVDSVSRVEPKPEDAYKYDDFRGSLTPYAYVGYNGGTQGFYVKDLGTTYELYVDEDGNRRPKW